jgi:alpha-tubulin suppressor-like RCC1 family protein
MYVRHSASSFAACAAFCLASAAAAQCPNPLVAWGRNNEGQCNVPQALGRVQSFAASERWSVAFARGKFTTWGAAPTGSGPLWVNPPQDPSLGGGVPTLHAGNEFTMAVNPQNGRVACWGSNANGECNVPSDLPAIRVAAAGPSHVVAIEAGSRLVRAWGRGAEGQTAVPSDLGPCLAVAAGTRHSVAVTTSGAVRCWGQNFRGACDVPAEAYAVSHVDTKYSHSLAQRGDFSLVAWGWNEDGQCTIPSGMGEVRDGGIAAGLRHSAAIVLNNGSWTVRCWGSNMDGACDVPAGLTDVVEIAASFDRTMALTSTGRVVAWGKNDVGEGSVPDGADNPELISAGDEFSIASSANPPYRVFAWGNNQYGQHNLAQPATGQRYTQLSAGWSHVVGLLNDGTLRCAGGSWSGLCGNMPALSNIRQVAASGFYTMAVDSNDTIRVWEQVLGLPADFWDGHKARIVAAGNDAQAMVRLDGTFNCRGGWVYLSVSPCDDDILGNFGDITQIAIGLRHVLVRRADGSLHVWTVMTDDPNLNVPANMGPVASIAAGDRHSVALTTAGRVYCWGENRDGQCNVPADIGKVKQIAAGRDHTVAIRDFGTPSSYQGSVVTACPYGRGDLNADGFVDGADLAILLALWGTVGAEIGDLSGDGLVSGADLGQLLYNWGPASGN